MSNIITDNIMFMLLWFPICNFGEYIPLEIYLQIQ